MVDPPLSIAPVDLPLCADGFGWQDFERFLFDFLMARPRLGVAPLNRPIDIASARFIGKPGAKQDGFDVVATTRDGGTIWFSAKHCPRSPWTKSKTAAAVAFAPPAPCIGRVLVVAASRPVGEGERKIATDAGWDLWDVRDLSGKFSASEIAPLEIARILTTYFGRAWSERFGHEVKVPWATATAHFAALRRTDGEADGARDRLFHHDHELVDRLEELKLLDAFASGTRRLLVLHSAPGVGKSRLLRAWCERRSEGPDDRVVRFISPDASTDDIVEAIRQANGSFLVILDGLRGSIQSFHRVLTAAIRVTGLEIVLSMESEPERTIDAALVDAGYDLECDVTRLEPRPLAESSVEALIATILPHAEPRVLDDLVRYAEGVPLIAVLSAELHRRSRLGLLGDDNLREYRARVYGAFVKQAQLVSAPAETIDDLLEIIALFGTLRLDDEDCLAILGLIGSDKRPNWLRGVLNDLVTRGLLVEDSEGVHVAMTAFADHLVESAAYRSDRGRATGKVAEWFDRLFDTKEIGDERSHERFGSILRNVARAEWTAKRRAADAEEILEPIWRRFVARLEVLRGDAYEQHRWLLPAIEVAAFAPRRCRELAVRILSQPKGTDDYWEMKVREQAVRILATAAQHGPESVGECLDTLSKAAIANSSKDGRFTQLIAQTARAVVEYAAWKPATIQRAALDWVERSVALPKTGAEGAELSKFYAFILRPMMEATTSESSLRSNRLSLYSVAVDLERTQELRDRVRTLCERRVGVGGPRTVRDILDVMSPTFAPARSRVGGQTLPKVFESRWEEERKASIQSVARIARSATDPVGVALLDRSIRDLLRRESDHELSKALRAILASLPKNLSVDLARVVTESRFWLRVGATPEDVESLTAEYDERLRSTAKRLLMSHAEDRATLDDVLDICAHWREIDGCPDVQELGGAIARISVERAIGLAHEAMRHTDPAVASLIPGLLTGIRALRTNDAAATDPLGSLLDFALERCAPPVDVGLLRTLAILADDSPELHSGRRREAWMRLAARASGEAAHTIIGLALTRPIEGFSREFKRDLLRALPTVSENLGAIREALSFLAHASERADDEDVRVVLEKAAALAEAEPRGASMHWDFDELARKYPRLVFEFAMARDERRRKTAMIESSAPVTAESFDALSFSLASVDFSPLIGDPSFRTRAKHLIGDMLAGHELTPLETSVLRASCRSHLGFFAEMMARVATEVFGAGALISVARFVGSFGGYRKLLEDPASIRCLLSRAREFGETVFEEATSILVESGGDRGAVMGVADSDWQRVLVELRNGTARYADDPILGPVFRKALDREEETLERMRGVFRP